MSDISTSVPVGLPDPFKVNLKSGLQYDLTTAIPISQVVTTGPSANQLKSALYYTGSTQTTYALPSANSIWKTFRPATGSGISVPVINRGTANVVFTGSDAYVTKSSDQFGVAYDMKDTSILLVCTTAISTSTTQAAFSLY